MVHVDRGQARTVPQLREVSLKMEMSSFWKGQFSEKFSGLSFRIAVSYLFASEKQFAGFSSNSLGKQLGKTKNYAHATPYPEPHLGNHFSSRSLPFSHNDALLSSLSINHFVSHQKHHIDLIFLPGFLSLAIFCLADSCSSFTFQHKNRSLRDPILAHPLHPHHPE